MTRPRLSACRAAPAALPSETPLVGTVARHVVIKTIEIVSRAAITATEAALETGA